MDKDMMKKVYEMVGAVKAFKMIGNVVDAGRYSLYKQVRDSKAYLALGKEWKDFCSEDLGRDQKTINMEIKLLEEYGENFITAAARIGLQKKDLYALGSGLSEDAKAGVKKGIIQIGDQEFKVTEIEENIDEFKAALGGLTKQMTETQSALKANQRLVDDFRKSNEKLNRELEKHGKKDDPKAITSAEEDFLKKMTTLRTAFDGYMLRVEPEKMTELEEGTARMKAAFLETIGYMKKQLLVACADAEEMFATPAMLGAEPWTPGKK